jgi:hypothetical protein
MVEEDPIKVFEEVVTSARYSLKEILTFFLRKEQGVPTRANVNLFHMNTIYQIWEANKNIDLNSLNLCSLHCSIQLDKSLLWRKKYNVACENALQDQNTQKICLNAGNVGKSNSH